MTIITFDIMRDEDAKPWIIDAGGLTTKLGGFKRLYGDNRINKQIVEKLTGNGETLLDNGEGRFGNYPYLGGAGGVMHKGETPVIKIFNRENVRELPEGFTRVNSYVLAEVLRHNFLQMILTGVRKLIFLKLVSIMNF